MSSSNNLDLYDLRTREFLQLFSEKQSNYEKLMGLAKEKCEKLLGPGSSEETVLKGIVQGRIKKIQSLEKKLEDFKKEAQVASGNDTNEALNFYQWVMQGGKIDEHPDMGDLVGVRIGLYFPDDIPKVIQRIEKHFVEQWLFGTVTGGRDATQGRNKDIDKHRNGPWHSTAPDGTHEFWEHYGYKSWQVVVNCKPKEGFDHVPVEIQVGTVVTQAWAEVQHNIIYKRSATVLATPTMKRMIDAINGLAITTDIMMKELERSLEDAEREANQQPFKSSAEFLDWFKSTYLSRWEPEKRETWRGAQKEIAVQLLLRAHEKGSQGSKGALCREKCSQLLEQSELLHDGMLKKAYLTADIAYLLWAKKDKVASGPEPRNTNS
ncbi:hypothetical protein HD806DRAFT_494029 [Xylariaceae sp. AK1471]|nr:hypothetical protein HD806DRAFT_494029 [Xylariaceae sp. AK1471]